MLYWSSRSCSWTWNDPDCLLFMALSCFSLTFPSTAWHFLFFFLSCGDEWTRHTISRHPWSWQRRHCLQVSSQFCLNFLSTFIKRWGSTDSTAKLFTCPPASDFISRFQSRILQGVFYFLKNCLKSAFILPF